MQNKYCSLPSWLSIVSVWSVCLSVCLFVCVFIYLSFSPPLSLCLSVCLSLCPFICQSVCIHCQVISGARKHETSNTSHKLVSLHNSYWDNSPIHSSLTRVKYHITPSGKLLISNRKCINIYENSTNCFHIVFIKLCIYWPEMFLCLLRYKLFKKSL